MPVRYSTMQRADHEQMAGALVWFDDDHGIVSSGLTISEARYAIDALQAAYPLPLRPVVVRSLIAKLSRLDGGANEGRQYQDAEIGDEAPVIALLPVCEVPDRRRFIGAAAVAKKRARVHRQSILTARGR